MCYLRKQIRRTCRGSRGSSLAEVGGVNAFDRALQLLQSLYSKGRNNSPYPSQKFLVEVCIVLNRKPIYGTLNPKPWAP